MTDTPRYTLTDLRAAFIAGVVARQHATTYPTVVWRGMQDEALARYPDPPSDVQPISQPSR